MTKCYVTQRKERLRFVFSAPCYSPMVIAKLLEGAASATVLERSLVIRMKRYKGEAKLKKPRRDRDWAQLRDDLYLWALRNWEAVYETFEEDVEVSQIINRKGDIWQVILSVAKVCLPQEDYLKLLAVATSSLPEYDEDDTPEEYEPIVDFLDDLRAQGAAKAKATDILKAIGGRLPTHLRGNKAFATALRELAQTQGFLLGTPGKGATLHVIFWSKNLPPQPPLTRMVSD